MTQQIKPEQEEQQKGKQEKKVSQPLPTSTSQQETGQYEKKISELQTIIRKQNDLLARQDNALKKQDERLRKLEAGPEPSKTEKTKRFYEDPDSHIGETVESKVSQIIDERLGPTVEFVNKMAANDSLAGIKNRIKADTSVPAVVKKLLDGGYFESVIDSLVKESGQTPSEDVILNLMYYIQGQKSSGQLKDPNEGDTMSGSDITPSHIRPSSGPNKERKEENPYQMEITETHRRLAREAGMTIEEYMRHAHGSAKDINSRSFQPDVMLAQLEEEKAK